MTRHATHVYKYNKQHEAIKFFKQPTLTECELYDFEWYDSVLRR